MENKNSTNLRVGFHSIEILLKLSPENIKKYLFQQTETMNEFLA